MEKIILTPNHIRALFFAVLFGVVLASCEPQNPALDNRLISQHSVEELKANFLGKSFKKKDLLEKFFGSSSTNLFLYSKDITGDGIPEELYGLRKDIKFRTLFREDIFLLTNFLLIKKKNDSECEVLVLADEDKIVNSKGDLIYQFAPFFKWGNETIKGGKFLRWWQIGMFPDLVKTGHVGISLSWILSQSQAREVGGGYIKEIKVLKWIESEAVFRFDAVESKKYWY